MGPLSGVHVLEFEGIGPAPFAGMLLADLGADVLLIDRPHAAAIGIDHARRFALMHRGKRSATLDLKAPGASEAVLRLIARADILIEGFRPGVMERLGVGPDAALTVNPKLVYGRMTGWGQQGPLAARAGHDINYLARSGVLAAIGPAGGKPVVPLNLIADFGGGGGTLALGLCSALMEARRSGQGQIVDAAMVDGASLMATMYAGLLAAGLWTESRGNNLLDGGVPWYDVYETADDHYMAVGAVEQRFYEALLQGLDLHGRVPDRHDRAAWPSLREHFTLAFRSRTRAEWTLVFDGSDACVTPVLTFSEARQDAHQRARNAYATVDGIEQPAPAPRFSRTPTEVRRPPPERAESGCQALEDWAFSAEEVAALRSLGLGCLNRPGFCRHL